MTKIITQFVIITFVPLMASASATDTLTKKIADNVQRAPVSMLHYFAQKLWPRTYQREIPEWRKLARACANAPRLRRLAFDANRKRMMAENAERSSGPLLISVTSRERQRIQAFKDLRENLLRKFDLHFGRIERFVEFERSMARNALSAYAVQRVAQRVQELGRHVRTSIERRDYATCAKTLDGLLVATH